MAGETVIAANRRPRGRRLALNFSDLQRRNTSCPAHHRNKN